MNMSHIVFAVTLALAGACQAQTMYRCGNTFSQQPCGHDGKVIAAPGVVQPRAKRQPPPDMPALPGVENQAKQLCVSALMAQLKDPESARVREIHRSRTDSWPLDNGSRRPVRYYWMTVNAKNSYGGYAGDKSYRCAMTIDEGAVLHISTTAESDKIIDD